MSEIALRFLLANVAAAVAILLVIAMRKPARAAFGVRLAYSLWLLVPLAAFGSLLPPRIVEIARPAPTMSASYPPPSFAPDFFAAPPVLAPADTPVVTATPPMTVDPWTIATLLWLAGGIAMLLWQMRNQSRFMADASAGFAGPAVAGFLRPRIITPSDFEDRFDRDERQVIIAHETIHLRRNDARINALVALLRCVCWFNPLVHLAAHLMRIDQELACDAAVVERHPRAKAVYASALLKAQLAARPLPIGCYWPAGADHPLTERVEMLKQAAPSRVRRAAGASVLAILALGACVGAWAAKPAEERFVATPAEAPGLAPARDEDPQSPGVFTANANTVDDRARGWLDARIDRLRKEVRNVGSPVPQPVRYEPQQTPASAASSANQPVYVRGKVEKIAFGDTTYVIHLRASSIGRDTSSSPLPILWGEDTNTALWEVSPTNYYGARDSIEKDLLGRDVIVRGDTSSDLSCASKCRLKVRELVVPKSTAVPAPAGRPFGVSDFAMYYDTTQPMLMSGKVQRLEFADRTFDVWMQTEGYGVDPGVLYQVRSEYFLPRVDIEARLRNQEIVASGWPARGDYHGFCSPVCGMYAEMMWLADGSPLTLGSTRPISPPPLSSASNPAVSTSPALQPTRYELQQTGTGLELRLDVTADDMSFDPMNEIVTYAGNVEVRLGGDRALTADRMTIQQVQRLSSDPRPTWTMRADTILENKQADTITLEGNAEARFGDVIFKGEKLTMSNANSRWLIMNQQPAPT